MNEIQRVLRVAAWRLLVVDLLSRLTVTVTAALIGLIGLRLAAAIFAWHFSWPLAFAAAGGGAVVTAVVWSLVVRSRGIAVARMLDERADLRESLSTALCVEGNPDPWAQVVVETARDRARRVVVRDAIPISAPRLAPMPFAAGVALVIAWFSIPPEFTWTKRFAEAQKKQEVREVRTEIQANHNELKEALKKAKIEMKEEEKPEGDGSRPEEKDPEAIRRGEIKRLTNMADRLNQLKDGEKGEQLKAAREAMSKLKQPGPGPLEELSRQLARGNFDQAKKALDDLAKKLADSSLSQEQKKQLESQLAKMSDQMAKLASDRQALEKKLEEAGMSKEQARSAAADPQALQKALDQLKNLTEEQKKQLSEQAKASQGACDKAGAMSDAMAKMAKGMSGQPSAGMEGMEGMEAMAAQLSEMEMLQSDMDALDAACKLTAAQLAGMCEGEGNDGGKGGQVALSTKQGKWGEGDTSGLGQGSGGPGRGAGGNPETTEAPFTLDPQKTGVKKGAGPIIGQTLVYGEQIKGSSSAEFAAMVKAGEKAATDSISTNLVAPEFQGAVKGYFGRLSRRAEEAKGNAPPPPSAPDAKDAEDAGGR